MACMEADAEVTAGGRTKENTEDIQKRLLKKNIQEVMDVVER